MAYEIDFIGVDSDKCSKDADAICLRWQNGIGEDGNPLYTIGVVDGGYEVHGEAMVKHLNKYYFNEGVTDDDSYENYIDFVVVTHPDQDHTIGKKRYSNLFLWCNIYESALVIH